jgi:hypothetical protein
MKPLSEWDAASYSLLLALVGGALLVCAAVIWAVKRWFQQTREDKTSSVDQLSQFRELYEDGELSSEEFARIRGMLTGKMIRELDKTPAPQPSPGPTRPPNPNTNEA